jgi:hypothetical protein
MVTQMSSTPGKENMARTSRLGRGLFYTTQTLASSQSGNRYAFAKERKIVKWTLYRVSVRE